MNETMRTPRPIYKLMSHKRIVTAVFLFLLPMMTLFAVRPLLAAPVYTLTPQAPGRIQEGNSIVLTLSLTGGLAAQTYTFNITVTQPDASTHTAQPSFLTDASGAGSASKSYASDFNLPTLGNTNLVGTYSVAVIQIIPGGALNPVATGSFTVGLTDKTTYQHTNAVLIQASGYGNGENVTVGIAQGATNANGFPKVVKATASGLVMASWQIPFNSPTGTWTVTAIGTSTVKTQADSQTMSVTIATLQVLVTTDQSSYARTQTITAFATVHYPDGEVLNSTYPLNSFANVRVTFDNGSIFRFMAWNATAQNWYASAPVPAGIAIGSLPQVWNVQVTASDSPGNTGTGSVYITIQLIPSTPDLQVTVVNSTGYNVGGVFLNITQTNGTLVTTAITDATGNAFFTLREGNPFTYWLVASKSGYNDHLNFVNLQGNLMHLTVNIQSVLYSGSILSGGFTTKASYNPGDSGQFEVWIYNQNTTFTLTVTKIEVQFPWFATYGNSYQGNVTVTGLPATVGPKTNWNTTVSFTVPNDGRLAFGSGSATIYITAHISAWKTAWAISPTGNPSTSRILDTAYINPYNNAYYASHGFVGYGASRISTPTQDTAAAADLTIIEVLAGISILNVVFLALIWMRLKPQGAAAAMAKV